MRDSLYFLGKYILFPITLLAVFIVIERYAYFTHHIYLEYFSLANIFIVLIYLSSILIQVMRVLVDVLKALRRV